MIGLGALSVPTSALNIKSSKGLEVFANNSNYFSVETGGPVKVKNTDLEIGKDLLAKDGELIWDESNSQIPANRIEQGEGSQLNADTVDGVEANSLGASALNIEGFAPNFGGK